MGESRSRSSSEHVHTDENNTLTLFPNISSSAKSQDHESANQSLRGLLDGNGPSMFDDDKNLDASNPQTLSAASNAVLQNVIDYHGAVELIKRLSAALAERDAHITALTRLAEEYNVPKQRIVDTASRVRQAERRRLSLAAASEDLAPSSAIGSDSGESHGPESPLEVQPNAKGLTKLFGGIGKQRESLRPTPASSRPTSRPPPKAPERPRSVDTQSVRSAHTIHSTDNGWTASLFGATSFPKRQDSRTNNRVPVEMTTRHDIDQLPPTLSNQSDDPQEAEWNRFLVRLGELRHQNGQDFGAGEVVGASRFGQEGTEGRKKQDQLTRLVLGGVPMKMRHPIWMELSNTYAMMRPDVFSHLLSLRDNEDPAELDAILKDVPRTLTTKYDFYSGKGFRRLKEVLVAFVGKYPNLGYTQGLNTIAGYLLLAIPLEEDAFWVLCNIVENFFPPDYFSRTDTMNSPLADNILLRQYVKELLPQLGEHMDKLKVHPTHTVPIKWFFTAFSSALPETTLMRLWDVWLCLQNQKHFLFAFSLAILSQNSEGIMACEDDSSYFSYLDNSLDVPAEDAAQLTELIKLAYKIGKKLENVSERRAELKEGMRLENKLRRRKTQSLEVLIDQEVEAGQMAPQQQQE